jgi:hypothetical protein
MKMFKLIALISLIAFIAAITVAYFTYYKTTHLGGEKGVSRAWYSKNMFFVYISRKGSGGFPSVLGNLPVTSRIEGADYATFEYIDDGFAKDKNYFYYPNEVTISKPNEIDYSYFKAERVELDPAKPIKTVFVEPRDNSLLYTKYYIFGAEIFHAMKYNPQFFPDGKVYIGKINPKRTLDSKEPTYRFNYETFTPYPCEYVKDINGVYYIGQPNLIKLKNADIETFNVKLDKGKKNNEDCHATDKNFQYVFVQENGGNFEIGKRPLSESRK